VSVRGGTATVTVDGAALVSLPLSDPQLASGQVRLGAINDARNGDASAAFANVSLRSPTVGTPVSFPDLSAKGVASSVVRLYSYNAAAHSVVNG
jgi:hypothetical protein